MNECQSRSPQVTSAATYRPDIIGYLNTSVADFFIRADHRWLLYATLFILAGLGTFVGVWIYDISYDQINELPLTFSGMYAWHTAANFVVCFFVLDILILMAPSRWGRYRRRSVGKTWFLLLGAYLMGFVIQRTLIYHLVDLYSPLLILHHENYPLERPRALPMFFYMLPFWLTIGYAALRMILYVQRRSEELLRVRVDTILEERLHRLRRNPPPPDETPAAEAHLQLPLDPGVAPIQPSQIGHITVEDHYLRIHYHCDGQLQNTLMRMSLKEISARVPGEQFVQIHRSHIVNLEWISGVKRAGREVRLTMKHGAFTLPVSRYRLPRLLPVLDRFLNPAAAERN